MQVTGIKFSLNSMEWQWRKLNELKIGMGTADFCYSLEKVRSFKIWMKITIAIDR